MNLHMPIDVDKKNNDFPSVELILMKAFSDSLF